MLKYSDDMHSKLLVFLIGITIVAGCSPKRSDQNELVSITAPVGETYLGIFFTGEDSVRIESFKKLAKEYLPAFSQISQFPDSITQDSYFIERYPLLFSSRPKPL